MSKSQHTNKKHIKRKQHLPTIGSFFIGDDVKHPARQLVQRFLNQTTDATAHWYSILFLDDDIPCFSNLIGLKEENVHKLFELAGLGYYRGSNFCIKYDEWTTFTDCEITKTKVVGLGNASPKGFIMVGKRYYGDVGADGKRGRSPYISNINKYRNQLQNGLYNMLSEKVVKNNIEVVNQNAAQSLNSKEDYAIDNNALLYSLKYKLLPLILKKDILDTLFWKDKIDDEKIFEILSEICGEIHQEREEKLSTILGTSIKPLSPQTKSNPNSFPIMKQYNIPIGSERVHEGLLYEIYVWNKKNNKSNILKFNHGNDLIGNLVYIPRSKNYRCLYRNIKKTDWFNNMLISLGGVSNELSALNDLLTYVARTDDYDKTYYDVVKHNGACLPELDEYTTWSIQSLSNMNEEQMHMLRRCLKAEIGKPLFSSPQKIKQVIGMEFVVPKDGVFKYNSR